MDETRNVGNTNINKETDLWLDLENLGGAESGSDGKNGFMISFGGRREGEDVRKN